MANSSIRLLELDDVQLEEFIELWIETKSSFYHLVDRIGAANDKGRDVIGFHTAQKHDGAWDLFQCKRKTRGAKLGLPEATSELGKLFFHHANGGYNTLPEKYVFVSPRGIVGPLMDLILNPSALGPHLLAQWDKHCATTIVKNCSAPLTAEIGSAIEAYDFSRVSYLSASLIVKDPHAQPALSKVLGLVPDEAPHGEVPAHVQPEELDYLGQLLQVYNEGSAIPFASTDEVLGSLTHGDHLRLQRTRFFEAATFRRFHRDNTAPGAIAVFQKDIYHGVIDVYNATHTTRLNRLNSVMAHAGSLSASLLGRATRIPVRQGMCHHLANEGELKWTK